MEYENICCECSRTFTTNDEEMNYCPECWEKLMKETFKDTIAIEDQTEEDNE